MAKKILCSWFNCMSGSVAVLLALAVASGAYAQPANPGAKITPTRAESVTSLIQHRKSVFSGKRSNWIGRPIAQIAKVVAPDTSCLGYFDGVSYDGVTDGTKVNGWAWSKKDKKAISQILLADGSGVVVGLASGGAARPDVVAGIPEIKDKATGWEGYSKYAHAVSAYGLIDSGRACQLHNSHDIAPAGEK